MCIQFQYRIYVRSKKLLEFVSGSQLCSLIVKEISRLQKTKKLLVFVSGAFFISWIPLNIFNILSDTCSLLVIQLLDDH